MTRQRTALLVGWLAGLIVASIGWYPEWRHAEDALQQVPDASATATPNPSFALPPRIDSVRVVTTGPSRLSAVAIRAALAPEIDPLLGSRLSDVPLPTLYQRLNGQKLLVGSAAYQIEIQALLVGEQTEILVRLKRLDVPSGS